MREKDQLNLRSCRAAYKHIIRDAFPNSVNESERIFQYLIYCGIWEKSFLIMLPPYQTSGSAVGLC